MISPLLLLSLSLSLSLSLVVIIAIICALRIPPSLVGGLGFPLGALRLSPAGSQ